MNKYLVRKKESEGGIISQICSGVQVLEFIEYLDLTDVVDYDIKLIDGTTFDLHPVTFKSELVSYETGAHYLYIYKDGDDDPENCLDCQYFPHDH